MQVGDWGATFCDPCRGTGIGEIPIGSSAVCGVCWKSGKDHMKEFRNVKMPEAQAEPTKMPDDGDDAVETRRQRRARCYGKNDE